MRFRECFAYLAGRQTDGLVVLSAGTSSEMWWDVTHEAERAFYLEASMSLASLFALLALSAKKHSAATPA